MSSVQDDDGGGRNSESRRSSGAGSMGSASENFEESRRTRRLRSPLHALMYQAAFEGNWQTAQIVLQVDPNVVHEKITQRGDTALHVAALAKRTNFVRELVRVMDAEDFCTEINDFGYTAFIYAATSGVVEIANVMREKWPDLVTYCWEGIMKPIYWAALLGHSDMVSYLYQFTPFEALSTEEWFALLLATIENKMYDIALKILKQNSSLATMIGEGRKSALRLLAKHDISPNINTRQEALLQSLVHMSAAIPCLSGLTRLCEKALMRKRAWSLAQTLWHKIQMVEDYDLFDALIRDPPILRDAADVGNFEFVAMLIGSDPDLIFQSDSTELSYTMLHVAVLRRQDNVFRYFHQTGSIKELISMGTRNSEGNNILHLAGKLAPEDRLNIVAGPALQMQRELIWFKEVEKIVPISSRNAVNHKGRLPRTLFSEEHKDLLIDAKNWMKETANYCMITATLIATIVFAASITVPGGNNGEKGSPILLNRSFFTTFVVCDVAAMFFSTFSIIMFLSILTSRFKEDDFLVSLPGKLIFGLTALFFSIVSTIGAFTSTCFLLFTDQSASIAASVAAVACLLLTFSFVRLHFSLWIDTVQSTYCSSFLFRPSKYSLFWDTHVVRKCKFYPRFVGCSCGEDVELGL